MSQKWFYIWQCWHLASIESATHKSGINISLLPPCDATLMEFRLGSHNHLWHNIADSAVLQRLQYVNYDMYHKNLKTVIANGLGKTAKLGYTTN